MSFRVQFMRADHPTANAGSESNVGILPTAVGSIYNFFVANHFPNCRERETRVDAVLNLAYLVGGNVLDVVIAAAVGVAVLPNVTRAVIILRQH
jgi:hypothetical protein